MGVDAEFLCGVTCTVCLSNSVSLFRVLIITEAYTRLPFTERANLALLTVSNNLLEYRQTLKLNIAKEICNHMVSPFSSERFYFQTKMAEMF